MRSFKGAFHTRTFLLLILIFLSEIDLDFDKVALIERKLLISTLQNVALALLTSYKLIYKTKPFLVGKKWRYWHEK